MAVGTGRRRRFYTRVWGPCLTHWYIVWQRLQPDATLAAVVSNARAGRADALCAPDKKLSTRLRSLATTSFSDARQRLPVRWVRQALTHFTHLLRAPVVGLAWHGLTVVVRDGSTLRVRPHGNLAKRFPPVTNQLGAAYWGLVRVVVACCAHSGLGAGNPFGTAHGQRTSPGRALLL